MAVLELKGVSKHFGAIEAVTNIDFSIEPGEVVGLMGDNGAGKSTLVKIIAGNFPPSSGEILLEGSPVHFHKPADARAAGNRGGVPGSRALQQSDGRGKRLPGARAEARVSPLQDRRMMR